MASTAGWTQNHSGWHSPASHEKAAREDRASRIGKIASLREAADSYDDLGKTERAAAFRAEADRLESNV